MKKILYVMLSCLCTQMVAAQTINLNEGWECQSSEVIGQNGAALSTGAASSAKWYSTNVPTTVMGALVANGEYPGILEKENYRQYDTKRFQVPWLFKKSFRLDGLNEKEHVRLSRDSIIVLISSSMG